MRILNDSKQFVKYFFYFFLHNCLVTKIHTLISLVSFMKKVALLTAFSCIALSAFAADLPADAQRVKALVKQKMNIDATLVRKLPVGLYEVVVNRNLVYVDKDVKFFVAGEIYDIASQRNLTQIRRDELAKIDPGTLPVSQAIKTIKGNGQRVLYTFSDPFCSYCQRLERTLQTLDNVTIYTFVVPLLNSDAMVERIFCSTNPNKAWHDWMLEHKEPAEKNKSCQTSTTVLNAALINQLGIEGVPVIYFKDGSRLEGAVSKDEIEQKLASLK